MVSEITLLYERRFRERLCFWPIVSRSATLPVVAMAAALPTFSWTYKAGQQQQQQQLGSTAATASRVMCTSDTHTAVTYRFQLRSRFYVSSATQSKIALTVLCAPFFIGVQSSDSSRRPLSRPVTRTWKCSAAKKEFEGADFDSLW